MAIELAHGPQISGEHPPVEKEIPSLLNRFSKNFRSVITSCLQKDPSDVRKLTSADIIIEISLATCFYVASNSCSTAESSFCQKDEENNFEGP